MAWAFGRTAAARILAVVIGLSLAAGCGRHRGGDDDDDAAGDGDADVDGDADADADADGDGDADGDCREAGCPPDACCGVVCDGGGTRYGCIPIPDACTDEDFCGCDGLVHQDCDGTCASFAYWGACR